MYLPSWKEIVTSPKACHCEESETARRSDGIRLAFRAVRGLVKENLSEAAVIADEGPSKMLMLLIWGNLYYNPKKHMKMSMGYL